ncbi:hypothetical protein JHK86_043625 [Glycine max]|nr:hypothetical protein JHK86_043625 [Glycine max]
MVVGFVSRLGWRHGGRVLLVMVRSRTADGGDSNSAVSEALFTRKAREEIKDQRCSSHYNVIMDKCLCHTLSRD